MKVVVSVIIPSYKCEAYIAETIASVQNQSFKDLEIIVVDDGSPDKQAEVIKSIAEKDSRIQYVYQKNQGVSAARNHGYKLSSGKYIAFLDSDDVWLPNNLELKIQKLGKGDFGLVHSDAEIINEKSIPQKQFMRGKEGDLLQGMLAWEDAYIPGPSSILLKKEVIDQIGDFDTNLSTAADQDFFFRVASKYAIGRVAQVTWQYRVHDKNMHSNIAAMQKDVIYVYKKARKNGLFHSKSFERSCFANMYLILAASWAGDGKKPSQGFMFGLKAVFTHPPVITKVLGRIFKSS